MIGPSSIIAAIAALVAVNGMAILAFSVDKRAAQRGDWRVAESTLLMLALIGGSPGAVWARRRFRHKTRKQPFTTQLDLIAMLHAGLAMGGATVFLF